MSTVSPDFVPQDPAHRAAGLWGDRTLPEELAEVAAAHPEAVAVVSDAGSLTYGELDAWTDRVGAGLLLQGLEPGDRVLLQVTNRLESVVAWWGLLKAALVPVATLAAHREHEIAEISRQCGARGHLVEAGLSFDLVDFAAGVADGHPTLRHLLTLGAGPDHRVGVRMETLGSQLAPEQARALLVEAQREVGPDDLAALQLSGGTTGTPKLIPRQHAEYWYNAAAYAARLGWSPRTRVAHLIPVVHNAGITCAVHAAASVGATLVLGTPDPAQWVPLMAREHADAVLVGHGHYAALAADGVLDALTSLRQVVLSGAKVPDAHFEDLERRGIWAGQLFGMGEGLFVCSRLDDPREARLRSVGTPLSPRDEVRLLEPGSDREVDPGQTGELCCRGPYTIRSYYRAAGHDRVAFTTDGFYRTGDLARWVEHEGSQHLHIEGRIKDVINRGGEKVSAEEVERLLLAHPEIREAAVVAMPDPRLGERACAFLVADRTLAVADLQEHLGAHGVAKYKWPEHVVVVAELPRTNVGKVDKAGLRRSLVGS